MKDVETLRAYRESVTPPARSKPLEWFEVPGGWTTSCIVLAAVGIVASLAMLVSRAIWPPLPREGFSYAGSAWEFVIFWGALILVAPVVAALSIHLVARRVGRGRCSLRAAAGGILAEQNLVLLYRPDTGWAGVDRPGCDFHNPGTARFFGSSVRLPTLGFTREARSFVRASAACCTLAALAFAGLPKEGWGFYYAGFATMLLFILLLGLSVIVLVGQLLALIFACRGAGSLDVIGGQAGYMIPFARFLPRIPWMRAIIGLADAHRAASEERELEKWAARPLQSPPEEPEP